MTGKWRRLAEFPRSSVIADFEETSDEDACWCSAVWKVWMEEEELEDVSHPSREVREIVSDRL